MESPIPNSQSSFLSPQINSFFSSLLLQFHQISSNSPFLPSRHLICYFSKNLMLHMKLSLVVSSPRGRQNLDQTVSITKKNKIVKLQVTDSEAVPISHFEMPTKLFPLEFHVSIKGCKCYQRSVSEIYWAHRSHEGTFFWHITKLLRDHIMHNAISRV